MGNTQDEAFGLFEDMAMNNYQWPSKRILPRKVAGLHDLMLSLPLLLKLLLLLDNYKVAN